MAFGFVFGQFGLFPAETAFSADASHFAPIVLPAPPAEGVAPTHLATDSGSLYLDAVALYQADRPAYENFAQLVMLDAARGIKAIEPIVAAAST